MISANTSEFTVEFNIIILEDDDEDAVFAILKTKDFFLDVVTQFIVEEGEDEAFIFDIDYDQILNILSPTHSPTASPTPDYEFGEGLCVIFIIIKIFLF